MQTTRYKKVNLFYGMNEKVEIIEELQWDMHKFVAESICTIENNVPWCNAVGINKM